MLLKQKIIFLVKKIKQLPILIKISLATVLFMVLIILVISLQDKPVEFSYTHNTCIKQLTFLPNLTKLTGSDSGFTVKNDDIVKLGDVQFFSLKTCFTAKKVPLVGDTKVRVALFGGWFAKKTFKLSIPHPPTAKLGVLLKPIPTARPLSISLSSNDLVFDYGLEVDGKFSTCPVDDSSIKCDIASLHLSQDSSYSLKLVRMFDNQKVDTLVSQSIKTLSATSVTSSSVSQGQVVYDKPKTFTFNFDKDVVKGNITLEKVEGEKRTVLKTTSIFNNKQVTTTIVDDLPRDVSYRFSINQLEAKDGSTLIAPYNLDFKMSGGPSVTGVNAKNTGLQLTQTIVLTFDQALSAGQDITKFVSTSGIPASLSRINNQVFVRYSNAPMCTDISIRISPGLMGSNGVTQNKSWSFNTRTICHTVSNIGRSKEGRPIIAYTFGSGGKTVLYTGSIHGNELSTKYLMEAWINELELNARSIPADKKIVVIPTLNPDGVAANKRNNSNNVDLNRNFDTFDWQKDIVTPGNQPIPGGGGQTPMSEVECQAIAAFTLKLRPRLTMSFHSAAGYVIANQGGDSVALAATYSQLSGYRNMTGNNSAFSYSITGTYDDWIREKIGLTSVLVELTNSVNSGFSKNKTALWAMARS